jgi:voltage-gated potassium channel
MYELLHTPEIETTLERITRIVITTLIIASILSVMLETVKEIDEQFGTLLYAFEVFTVIVFTIEYVFRVWSIVEDPQYSHPIIGRIRYIISFMAIIDFIAVFPFYLPGIVRVDLRFLRGLRLFRLLRIFKLGRYSSSLNMISHVISSKRHDIAVTLFVIIVILVLSSSLMYFLEHEAQPNVFPSIPATLWWGVATLTTIGYGDVYPVTVAGRICASIISVLGIGLFALPSGILVAGFIEEINAQKSKPIYPHCGKEIV